ncbi:alanine racemase [Qipengyuania sp. JC766]|uniref:alanine racemase n=1 Tax=Qipengyuania sp. JC766 TaxID=3232139 RepID=UPI003459D6F8
MPTSPPPTLRLRIDTDALAANWTALDRLSGTATAGAAVKANAYGLGVEHVVPVLREAGARHFFVAHWSEVEAVAAHVPASQIAVLHGIGNAAEAEYARAVGALPVINSVHQAAIWLDTGGGPCHLMVDTGINRLGIGPAEGGSEPIRGLEIDTLMSHLACADEDVAMNAQQLTAFESVARQVPHRLRSLANSAGIALGPAYHFDLSRPGLSLYGGIPRRELADAIAQVAFPQAAIIQRRRIAPGESVGYNATFVASQPMDIAVVSLGYADGFLRSWGGEGYLLHQGTEVPLLGRVSMDMVVVDLSNAPDLREGDWLDLPYHLPTAARLSGLSQYELLTTLGSRFGSA